MTGEGGERRRDEREGAGPTQRQGREETRIPNASSQRPDASRGKKRRVTVTHHHCQIHGCQTTLQMSHFRWMIEGLTKPVAMVPQIRTDVFSQTTQTDNQKHSAPTDTKTALPTSKTRLKLWPTASPSGSAADPSVISPCLTCSPGIQQGRAHGSRLRRAVPHCCTLSAQQAPDSPPGAGGGGGDGGDAIDLSGGAVGRRQLMNFRCGRLAGSVGYPRPNR